MVGFRISGGPIQGAFRNQGFARVAYVHALDLHIALYHSRAAMYSLYCMHYAACPPLRVCFLCAFADM